jgi:hypothetical protein
LTSYYFTATDPEYLFRLKRQAHGLGLAVNGTAVGNNFACRRARPWTARSPM